MDQPLQGYLANSAWANTLLRLVVGIGFMAHAFAKLSRGADNFASTLQALGVPAANLMPWATIATELIGGALLAAGALVFFASIPLAVVMAVAMFTVHLRYGFNAIKLVGATSAGPQFGPPGYELNLLYLAALAVIAFGGTGPWSVDAWLLARKRSQSRRAICAR
jgi:putative oxidoreductase